MYRIEEIKLPLFSDDPYRNTKSTHQQHQQQKQALRINNYSKLTATLSNRKEYLSYLLALNNQM